VTYGRAPFVRRLAAALTGVAVLAACGVTQDPAARPVAAPPFKLLDATTTTTTEPPPPTTTVPPTTTTTAPAPSTTVPTETLSLYYAVGDRVRRVFRAVASPPGAPRLEPQGVFRELQTPPDGSQNLATADLLAAVTVDRGRATAVMTPAFFALTPPVLLAATAQLVLTFTDRPGIGYVVFTDEAGQPLVVPRADGSVAQDVSAEDYRALLVD
jgi:hypothetical protein